MHDFIDVAVWAEDLVVVVGTMQVLQLLLVLLRQLWLVVGRNLAADKVGVLAGPLPGLHSSLLILAAAISSLKANNPVADPRTLSLPVQLIFSTCL
jgi:hypothetical protein